MATMDMGQFAREFTTAVAGKAQRIIEGVQAAMTDEAEVIARQKAPVRSGALRASEQKIPGSSGKPSQVVFTAPHAAVIDRGRRRSKTVKGKAKRSRRKGVTVQQGKMLGSKQAPRGISGPTGREVLRRGDRIATEVIQRIDGGEL